MIDSKPNSGVRPLSSVLKALAVLDVLGRSDKPMRLAEVAAVVAGSRATTYQKLVTLIAAGWVEQTDAGAYRLSLHAAHMGEAALDQASLGERATIILRELVQEVKETASIAVLSDIRACLAKRVEAEVVVRAQVKVGSLLSLDNSSSGRVLTAFASPQQLRDLVDRGAVLASQVVLDAVRRNGYAISTGKDTPGVQSVGMPLFDASRRCVAALSIVAPATRFDAPRYVEPLRQAAQKLNALMSVPGGRSVALGQSE
jgi:DNA-binding IclR family transcriptional regulator